MAKRLYRDPVLTKPLPSTTVPKLVILCLLVGIWLAYRCFFGAPEKLLGGKLPANQYYHYLQQPKAKAKPIVPSPAVEHVPTPAAQPADQQTTPSDSTPGTDPSAPAAGRSIDPSAEPSAQQNRSGHTANPAPSEHTTHTSTPTHTAQTEHHG
jgi:hypothetical protein